MKKRFDSPMKDRSKDKTVKDLLNEFADQTSMHGVARVGSRERHAAVRLLWAFILLAGAVYCAYNVLQIALLYMNNPLSTVVSMERRSSLTFPAVTLCNLNAVRQSQLDTSPVFARLRHKLRQMEVELRAANRSEAEVDFELRWEVKKQIPSISNTEKLMAGHQLDTILLDCHIGPIPCYTDNFTAYVDEDFGVCFVFNKFNSLSVNNAGPLSGLRLMLNIEAHEYLAATGNLGIRMVIQQTGNMPFPLDEGMLVGPGFETEVGLTKKINERTPAPYGDCRDYSTEENKKVNLYANFDADYTNQACYSTCHHVKIAGTCGCFILNYPGGLLADVDAGLFYPELQGVNLSSLGSCNFFVEQTARCVRETTELFKLNSAAECSEACFLPCREEVFQRQISMASWPPKTAIKWLRTSIQEKVDTMGTNVTVDDEFLGNSVVRVMIFYSSFDYEVVKTEPAYDWASVLADVGGQVGLWLGFSLMTAAEMCELLIRTLRLLLARLRPCTRANEVQDFVMR